MKLDLEINKGFKLHYASETEKPERWFRASHVRLGWHLRHKAWPFLHTPLSCKMLLKHRRAFVFAQEQPRD